MFTAIVNYAGHHGYKPKAALIENGKKIYANDEQRSAREVFNGVVQGAKVIDFMVGVTLVVLAVLTTLGYIPCMAHIGTIPTLAMGMVGAYEMGGTLEGIEGLLDRVGSVGKNDEKVTHVTDGTYVITEEFSCPCYQSYTRTTSKGS